METVTLVSVMIALDIIARILPTAAPHIIVAIDMLPLGYL